jgi:molecular chaperone DnaJ
MPKDYYKVLGVERSASQDEIKAAFRKKAHEHHPDKGGDEAKFKEINEAYQALGDAEKRQRYDQFGSADAGAGFGGGAGGFGGFDFSDMGDLGDLFGGMFGGGGGRRRGQPRGADLETGVTLSFKEAVFGASRELELERPGSCERCGGVGAEPGSKMKTCDTCKGQGYTVQMQRTVLGTMQMKADCGGCHGAGETPEKACTTCHGRGIQRSKKRLSIDIPPGVEQGMQLRVRGEGEGVKGGAAGDLYVTIRVTPDVRFTREGATIRSTLGIGFTTAALGGEVTVETLEGSVTMTIPAGTQAGEELRLRGKGGVNNRGGRGDHLVKIQVLTPKGLSRAQKKLLEELNLE